MPTMEPYLLIAALAERTGESVTQLATRMDRATFQGTLHRFLTGASPNPTRYTAKRIAKFFDVPVDALYDGELAAAEATRLGVPLDFKPAARPEGERRKPSKPSKAPKASAGQVFFRQLDQSASGPLLANEGTVSYTFSTPAEVAVSLFTPEMLASLIRLDRRQRDALARSIGLFLEAADPAYAPRKALQA